MANIYDGYQLSNSRLTKPFVGSTLNELNRVSDVLQQRYDASVLGMDAMTEFMKQAKALPKDQPLLAARLQEYKGKLDEWSARKDLENVPMDVMRASRQLAGEYQNFAASYQKAAEYSKHLDDLTLKGPGQGGISKSTADELKRKASEDYQGVQRDNATGRYDGIFQGDNVSPEVDTAAWIKKVAGDVAASKNERLVESDGGLYFVTNSGSRREVNFEKDIKPRIREAYSLDPEIQSDFRQRSNLAAFRNRNVRLTDIPNTKEYADLKNQIGSMVAQGIPENQAVQSAIAQTTHQGLINTLENFGRKYAFTETASGFTINDKTLEGEKALKKIQQPDTLLALAYTTPGGGTGPTSAGAVEGLIADGRNKAGELTKQYADFMKGKTVTADGRVLGRDENGQVKDMTSELKGITGQMLETNKQQEQLESVKKAVASKVGFDPTNTKKYDADANKFYLSRKETLTNDGGIVEYTKGDPTTGTPPQPIFIKKTKEELEKIAQADRTQFIQQRIQSEPGFKRYEEELVRRLNPAAESSTLVMIQDPTIKKAWSDNITALASGLGLKQGALAFTIGGGPDQGSQITASQYDEIKGNVEVIGFDTDKSGQTVLKLRAFKNVKGKKTEGEDLVLNLSNTNVDEYLRKEMDPQQFMQFKGVGQIKKVTNNNSRSGSIQVPGTNETANIAPRDGKWIVTLPKLPGQAAPQEVPVDSYEGVLDLLLRTSAILNPPAKTK